MRRIWIFSLLVGFLALAVRAGAQTDFDDYVASIRESGMSERGGGDVRMMANILVGGSDFKAWRAEDGSIGHSYGSLPGGRDRREGRQSAATRESWTAFLKQQADADHSGFVSTKEGGDIRRLIEMGLAAEQLKLRSLGELERAQPLNSSEADLAAYTALRAEAMKQGLEGLPPLQGELARNPAR